MFMEFQPGKMLVENFPNTDIPCYMSIQYTTILYILQESHNPSNFCSTLLLIIKTMCFIEINMSNIFHVVYFYAFYMYTYGLPSELLLSLSRCLTEFLLFVS